MTVVSADCDDAAVAAANDDSVVVLLSYYILPFDPTTVIAALEPVVVVTCLAFSLHHKISSSIIVNMTHMIDTHPVGISDISVRENVSSESELTSNGYTTQHDHQQLPWNVHSPYNLLLFQHCL